MLSGVEKICIGSECLPSNWLLLLQRVSRGLRFEKCFCILVFFFFPSFIVCVFTICILTYIRGEHLSNCLPDLNVYRTIRTDCTKGSRGEVVASRRKILDRSRWKNKLTCLGKDWIACALPDIFRSVRNIFQAFDWLLSKTKQPNADIYHWFFAVLPSDIRFSKISFDHWIRERILRNRNNIFLYKVNY